MKTLQTSQMDFTSSEQSKRLLELGVPADSANMHYHQECVRMKYGKEEFEYFLRCGKPDTNKYSTDIPSWSVGRLIKIYFICSYQPEILIDYTMEDLVDYLVSLFESVAMNFSKLEE